MSNYKCKHCGGRVVRDEEKSTNQWNVWLCKDCGSHAPLSTEDLMKEVK